MRQVRIDDDVADWLAEQGGSLSAAANRTLRWARDVTEQVEQDDDEPDPDDRPARATRTSTSVARGRASARAFGMAVRDVRRFR